MNDNEGNFKLGVFQLESFEPIAVLVERREASNGKEYWRVRFHGTIQGVSTLPEVLAPFEFIYEFPDEEVQMNDLLAQFPIGWKEDNWARTLKQSYFPEPRSLDFDGHFALRAIFILSLFIWKIFHPSA